MSLIKRNKGTAAMCAVALMVSSSAASAAATPQTVQPWLALSAMSSGSTASTAAAAATVAQDRDYDGGISSPPLIPLAIILATVALAIYLLVDDNDDDESLSPD